MKTMIVCVSASHGNTRKVAEAMADELGAAVVEPELVDTGEFDACDMIGFGSGIYGMAFHWHLIQFVLKLPPVHGKKAFVFATRGGPRFTTCIYVPTMTRLLRTKGFDVVGAFSCSGYDTWLPLRLVGGINKGHPDEGDLNAARVFARKLSMKHEREHVRPRR